MQSTQFTEIHIYLTHTGSPAGAQSNGDGHRPSNATKTETVKRHMVSHTFSGVGLLHATPILHATATMEQIPIELAR